MLIEMPLERQQNRPVPAGDPQGEREMVNVPDRVRLAMAPFNSGADLCPALQDLERAMFKVAQLGIAARHSVFSKLKQYVAGTLKAANVAQLVCGSGPLGVSIAHEPVRISAGPLWPALACFGSSQDQPLIAASWMAPQLREELARHLAKGAILLGVGAATVEQQKTATQILLNHCAHRVHTHDFRL